MTRRLLIVTSTYAPAMIADMHRARHLAWELPALGWRVEILCPDASYQAPSCMDTDSAEFFAPDAIVHYVPQLFRAVSRRIGLGGIGWRALLPMFLAGARLLRTRRFDLVYFSTTQFPLFLLGPVWRWVTGVPYVLDFHDPCHREAPGTPEWIRPGSKQALARLSARWIERWSVLSAAGIVSVSPDYLQALHRRYAGRCPGWIDGRRHAVIPFAVLPRDFAAGASGRRPAVTEPRPVRIVYVGAGGGVMLRSFTLLCGIIASLRARGGLPAGLRIELYGTMLGWAPGDPMQLAEAAARLGVLDLVHEDPRRVTYRKSIDLLHDCDGALVLGADDAGYMPSKLFSYGMTGKPLLLVVRRDGPAFALVRRMPPLGQAMWFDAEGAMPVAEAEGVADRFFRSAADRLAIDRAAVLEPYFASAMALRHAELFDACLPPA